MNPPKKDKNLISRRKFIGSTALLSGLLILPRHVLGGKGFVAPSDRVTLGFIGAGRQAHTLLRNFLPTDCQIVAVCDVYQSKALSFCESANKATAEKTSQSSTQSCRIIPDFKELLAQKDIDAVVIATPDHWHAAIAVRAAAAGKDIYSEKPLSLSVAEGRAMVNATDKYKRVFQTGSMQRSAKEFRHCVELVRNGYIGELKTVKVSIGGPPVPYDLPEEPIPEDLNWNLWLGPNDYVPYNHLLNPVLGDPAWGKWRDYKGLGGGDITDWGAHMFDIVQWAMDMDKSGPEQIHAPHTAGQNNLTYIYKNGVAVIHENFGKAHAIQFTGSEGVIEIQRNKLVVPENLKKVTIRETDKRVCFSDNHYKNFLEAIKTRKEPIASVETGHRSCTVCNIGNIAIELNRSLIWDPIQEKFSNSEANKLLFRKMKKEWAV